MRAGSAVACRRSAVRYPGSRSRSVRTCQGPGPRRTVQGLALTPPSVLPSAVGNASASEVTKLSRLNGWPARSPADASPIPSRGPTHGSGPMWIALPSSQWTLTTYSLPVSRRTPTLWHAPHVRGQRVIDPVGHGHSSHRQAAEKGGGGDARADQKSLDTIPGSLGSLSQPAGRTSRGPPARGSSRRYSADEHLRMAVFMFQWADLHCMGRIFGEMPIVLK
jgi:hypothetical protein